MTIINKPITEIIPYANNPRKNGAAVDKVAASIVSGHIPYIKAGKKYLIDFDVLFEYLKGTRPEQVLPGYKNPFGNTRA